MLVPAGNGGLAAGRFTNRPRIRIPVRQRVAEGVDPYKVFSRFSSIVPQVFPCGNSKERSVSFFLEIDV